MLIRQYASKKVADYLHQDNPGRICLIFWHGLGDLILFLPLLDRLRVLFADIQIDIALQRGVGQEELLADAILIEDPNRAIDGYDYSFQIHFPMAEHLAGLYTKQGWCCKQELGIDNMDAITALLPECKNPIVACHFQATALPGPINPDCETAAQIWQEIKDAGLIPLEVFFRHRYFNPVNEQFDFIDCTTRGCKPSILNLIGIYRSCFASVCVASGNLIVSLAVIPERTIFLQKEYLVGSYTDMPVKSIDINDYQKGSVQKCLDGIREFWSSARTSRK